MKRLLEWKQRMLQSPLTRKPSGSANRGRTQNDLSSYYKQQALLDLAAHEAAVAEGRHSRRREDGHRSHVRSKSSDGRRTAVNVPRYNSYSSDDEGRASSPELIILVVASVALRNEGPGRNITARVDNSLFFFSMCVEHVHSDSEQGMF